MRLLLTCLAVSAAALAATQPAISGDFNYGAVRLKDPVAGAAVPVPAPAPVPDTSGWYLRGDIGYTVGGGGRISTTGPDMGAFTSFGDATGPFVGTLGFGRYVTPSIRAEFTLDLRSEQRLSTKRPATSTVTYTESINPPPVPNTTNYQTISNYNVDATENLRSTNQALMFNLYRDFKGHSWITPYVGAGVGLNIRTTKRAMNASATCTGSYDQYVDQTNTLVQTPLGNCASGIAHQIDSKQNGVDTGYGVAAALMAGTAITVGDGIAVDLGYRFLWQQQNYSLTYPIGALTSSKISFDTRTDHELRTGMRFDLQ